MIRLASRGTLEDLERQEKVIGRSEVTYHGSKEKEAGVRKDVASACFRRIDTRIFSLHQQPLPPAFPPGEATPFLQGTVSSGSKSSVLSLLPTGTHDTEATWGGRNDVCSGVGCHRFQLQIGIYSPVALAKSHDQGQYSKYLTTWNSTGTDQSEQMKTASRAD